MKKVKKYISIMIIMLMIFENIETDGLLLKTTKIYGAETDKESVQEVDKDTSLETEEPQDIEVYNSDDEELVYGDYKYSIVDNTVTINKYIGSDSVVIAPDNIDGYNVTGIGDYAFRDCTNIKDIKLPEALESIGYSAFRNCIGLESIKIPSKVKTIGDYAFSDCANIKDIKLPETLESIGYYAFESCKGLESIKIPSKVKRIGQEAFEYCSNLKEINLPENIETLGSEFIAGTKIEEIKIPKSIQTGWNALYRAYELKKVEFEEGTETVISGICKANGINNKIEEIIIPNGVKEIEDSAFSGCINVKEIRLPETLETIGYYAFGYCKGLESIKIPLKVKRIGQEAFEYCNNLKEINLPEGIEDIGSQFIKETKIEKIQIPKSLKSGSRALSGATELKKVEFEEGTETIITGICSVYYSEIEEIIIPDGVTEIESYAFGGCINIKDIKLPETLESIGYYAFGSCTGLESIKIPSKVKTIGREAFEYCSNLKKIILPESVESIGTDAFSGCNEEFTIYGYEGTYAQQYANENNIPFKLADDDDFDDNNYIYGNLTLIDPLNWQIGIDGVKYNLDSNYELTDEVKLWVQESDKRVVCSIKNGNVNGIYRLSDVTSIYIKLSTDPSKLVYQNSKMNVSKFAVKADVQYLIDGKYNLPYSIKKQIYKDITNIELKTQSDGINFGKSGWGWFKDYKTSVSKDLDNSRVNVGSSMLFSEDIYINDDYKMYASTGVFDINCAVTFGDGTKSENKVQVQVGNLDYRDKVVEDKKNNSVMGTNVSNAQKILSSNANKAVTYDPMLDSYLTYEQQVHLKEVLYVWVSDIFAATNSSYCKNNNKIQDKIYKKLGIDKNSLTNIVNTNSTFKVELNTTVGKRTIEFDIKLSNYVLGQKVSYAGFGTMEFTMYKDRSKPELTGTGMVALTNMEGFVNQLTTIADNAIESAYMGIWGNDANVIANYLTSGTMLEVLKKNGVIKGTFSGNLYKLMKKPTTDYIEAQVHCPVDVYVYDSAGTLVGKIVNNEVDASFNELYMYTIGDSKYIQLTEDNYKLVLVGNDNGSMDYIVKEYDEDGNCKQTINYNNLDVVKGEKYSAAVPDALLLDASMYNLISYTGDYIEPTSVENSNDNIDDGNYEYVDKFNDLIIGTNLKTKLCQDINEYVIYGIKEETTVNDIKKMFPDSYIQIVSSNGELLQESEYVSTGCRINLIYDDNISDSVLIVIKGDVDGTGTIDVLDMETIQKSILGIGDTLSGVYKEAALLSGDSTDEVTVLDMEAIQKDILGIEKIN
jgi:hypothetical protein